MHKMDNGWSQQNWQIRGNLKIDVIKIEKNIVKYKKYCKMDKIDLMDEIHKIDKLL